MKIITLTLNPVYDIFYSVKEFTPFKENVAENVKVSAGGKGLNVSRALMKNGYSSTAFFLLGKENSQAYTDELARCSFEYKIYLTEGRIRENITLLCGNTDETRISANSFTADYTELVEMLSKIVSEAEDETVIICSGKMPKGISQEDSVRFVNSLKEITPYVILDSNSFSPESVTKASPWLIKPNEEELEAMTGVSSSDVDSVVAAAEKLNALGIKNVLVSLGGNGAVFVGELGRCIASVPKITPISTVGAGDSMIAGFVSAFAAGEELHTMIARACAYGTSACLEEGNDPPTPENVTEILSKILISET